jgi:RHS repeat-associated protein
MRKAVRSATLLAGPIVILGASPSFAQQSVTPHVPSSGPPLPNVRLTDVADVELSSGAYVSLRHSMSIGLADSPSLASIVVGSKQEGTPAYGYVWKKCMASEYSACQGVMWQFQFGDETAYSNLGQMSDGSFSTGTDTLGYKAYRKDGSIWTFAPTGNPGTSDGQVAYLTEIERADGEKIRLIYPGGGASGTRAVISSSGYQLATGVSGGVSSAVFSNRRTKYCETTDYACVVAGVKWPRVDSVALDPQGWGVRSKATFSDGSELVTAMSSAASTSGTTKIVTYTTKTISGSGVETTVVTEWKNSCPDGPDRVRSVTTPAGTWSYNYSGIGCRALVSLPPGGGQITVNASDPEVTITDQLQRKNKYNYLYGTYYIPSGFSIPVKNGLTASWSPEGDGVSVGYDSRYNPVSVSHTPKTGAPVQVWSGGYLAACTVANFRICNKPEYEIDANGNRTDFTYDAAHGGVLIKTLPPDQNGVRPQTRFSYQQLSAKVLDAAGQLVNETPIWKLVRTSECRTQASCIGTADEVVTVFSYDDNLLPITETVSSGDGVSSATTTRTYDPVGNLVLVDGPAPGNSDTVRFTYDGLRRPVATLSPDPDGAGPLPVQVTRTSYDGDGRPVTVESGTATDQSDAALSQMTVLQKAVTGYDAAGRKVVERQLANGSAVTLTQYSYDAAGRLECIAERMNPAAYASLPASACDLGTQGDYGPDRIIRNSYDAAGQLLKVEKAVGVTAANGFPETLQQDYATYSYSLNGKRTSVTDANGNRATMTFDGFDRQRLWTFPSKTASGTADANDYEEYSYDKNGNRLTLRKRDGRTFSYTWDALNRMVVKAVPDACISGYACTNVPAAATRDVYYSYDLRGLQTSARFDSASGADAVVNDYDVFGHLKTSITSMGGVSRGLSFLYDLSGNRTRVTHPDGNYFTYEYDQANRLVAIRQNGNGLVASTAWDATGRRSGETRGAANTAYDYDSISRLASLADDLAGSMNDVTTSFGYNPAGQIVVRTLSNAMYGFSGYTNVSRAYVVNGLNQYSSAGGLSFTYDSNGNLTGSGSTNYTYDAENRLTSASNGVGLVYDPLGRLFETSFGSGGITRFLYDGDRLTLEYDASGNVLRRYVHGAGEDNPLLWYDGAGLSDLRSLQANHQGSIVSVADATGATIEVNRYDEYGIPAGSNIGRFQYTGQAWIPELGMYHYKARIYSPTLGRFLQTDPVGYEDQVNLYAYVGNDPVNMHDPAGGWSKKVHDRIFQLAVGNRASRAQMGVISNTSVRQDMPWGNGDKNEQHFVRNPGESGANAREKFTRYVNEQIRLARGLADEGRTLDATRAFARAAHAIADSYSPAHNDNGQPAVYDPNWNPVDAALNGHSPLDFVGREGTDDLDAETQSTIVGQTSALYDSIFGSGANRKKCSLRSGALVCE